MSALTNATVGTSLTELIPADVINSIILPANRAPTVHGLCAWQVDVPSIGRGAVHRFPQWVATDPAHTEASPKTEAESGGFGTLVEIQTQETTATAVVVGLSSFVSDEAIQDAGVELEQLLGQQVEGMRERVSLDLLLNTKTATNSSDFSGAALNLTNWGTAYAAFEAQNPRVPGGMMPVGIFDNGQWRDLLAAIRASGGSIEATGRALELFSPIPGFKGYFENIPIISTTLTAENDASNHSGAIVACGTSGRDGQMNIGSALGLATWWGGADTPDGVVGGYKMEVERRSRELGNYLTTSARYGTTITNQAHIREIISQD